MFEWELSDSYPKYACSTSSLRGPVVGKSMYTAIATNLMEWMSASGFCVGSTGGKDGF
jgi:hypothetical protein